MNGEHPPAEEQDESEVHGESAAGRIVSGVDQVIEEDEEE